jgi:hypothetical protein
MRKTKALIAVITLVFLFISSSSILLAVQPSNKRGQLPGQEKTGNFSNQDRIRFQDRVQDRNQVRLRTKAFSVSGSLIEINESRVILKVEKASKNANSLIGNEVSFELDDNTKVVGLKTLARIDFIVPDNTKVTVRGSFVYDENGNQTATEVKRVVIKFPKIAVINGQIVSTGDGSIAVKVKSSTNSAKIFRGSLAEVLLFEKTKISYPSTLSAGLEAGLYVNVIGFIKDGKILALRIVVKAKPMVSETTGTASPDTTTTPGTTTDTAQTTDTGQISDSGETTSETTQSTEGSESGSEGLLTGLVRFIAQVFESILDLFR